MYLVIEVQQCRRSKKKDGVLCMVLHQWLILRPFLDVNESNIKFTNVSAAVMMDCTKCGDAEATFNNCPKNVRALHKYIKESDQNNEEALL